MNLLEGLTKYLVMNYDIEKFPDALSRIDGKKCCCSISENLTKTATPTYARILRWDFMKH
jgi:hypothetical protein